MQTRQNRRSIVLWCTKASNPHIFRIVIGYVLACNAIKLPVLMFGGEGNGFAHRFAISMAIFTFLTMHSALKMLHMPPPTPGTWIYAGMSISKNVTTFSLYFKWILLQIDFRMGCKTALTSLLRFHAHMNFNHEFWWCDHTNIDFKTLCRNHLKA